MRALPGTFTVRGAEAAFMVVWNDTAVDALGNNALGRLR